MPSAPDVYPYSRERRLPVRAVPISIGTIQTAQKESRT